MFRLDQLHVCFRLFQAVCEMVFQVVHQIDMKDLDFARYINQRGNGEIAVQSEKTDSIERRYTDKTFIIDNACTAETEAGRRF